MSDDTNGPDGFDPSMPASLLPYDRWMEEAQRNVMLKALEYVSEHGLPGDHHFYMTFRTGMAGVDIPARLRERYPDEMTIVLQHQFQNLMLNHRTRSMSVGLSFGGIPSTLHIPFRAITAFADPHIHLVLHFSSRPDDDTDDADLTGGDFSDGSPADIHKLHTLTCDPGPEASPGHDGSLHEGAEVVSLAAFRKKPSPDGRNS